MRKIAMVVIGVTAACTCAQVRGDIFAGRDISREDRAFSLMFTYGQILSVEGEVRETKRAGEDEPADRNDEYYDLLENYSLEELGFDSSYPTIGFAMERQWAYLTLGLDFSYSEPTASGTAEREPFAIGVDEIDFEGEEYEYMLIPQGQSYDADLQAGLVKIKALITPFNVDVTRAVTFSPWLHLGLTAALSHFEIDAGPAQGVTTYEAYPHQYVIGGKGSGWAGLVVPDLGGGGEFKIALGQMKGQDVFLSVVMDFALLDWAGSTSDIGASSRNEKDVGLDYMSEEIRVTLELPISEKTDLLLGLNFQHLDADAEVEAQDRTDEERAETLEKYDKAIEYSMTVFYGFIGLRF